MRTTLRRTLTTAPLLAAAALSVAGLAGGIASAAPATTAPLTSVGTATSAGTETEATVGRVTPAGCDQQFWLQGDILEKYVAMGGKDALGCPTTTERITPAGPNGQAKFNFFSNDKGHESAIYWTDPTKGGHGAVLVSDESPTKGHGILSKWRAEKFENGPHGFPVKDDVRVGPGKYVQDFQHGNPLDNQ